MNEFNDDKAELVLMLRSKTALGRLVDTEVHGVLDFLESIGFRHAPPAPIFAPVGAMTPEIQQAAQVLQVLPEMAPLAPPPID